jgi:hypothetical protein
VAREVHGDLRPEHIYLLPPGTPGRSERGRRAEGRADDHLEFVIIDCIEFNERFRWADPVADLAFLVMEMELVGRSDLAGELARRYFLATGDPEGAELLPYYVAYRGIVRGKVRSLQAADELMAPVAREGAAAKAGRHFLHALGRLSRPADRPALVVVQGLPGVGKSTVAEALSKALGFAWIDTDRVRRELAALDAAMADRETEAGYGAGLYSEEWNDRTYRECERRAREELWRGGRVVVEGSFRRERHRVAFLEAGRGLGVPVVFLSSSVEPAEARRRLAGRRAGPSEADWRIHVRMSHEWEAPSELTAPCTRRLSLDGGREDAVRRATAILCDMGLV